MSAISFSAESGRAPAHGRALSPALWTVLLWVAAALSLSGAPESLAHTWTHASTWRHGALAVPAALWLVWRRRAAFSPAEPSLVGAAIVAAGATAYALAHGAGINLGEQLAFFGVVVGAFATVFGLANTRRAALGLGFFFFAVPFGESLAPPLQQAAAGAVAALLEGAGVPIVRDGTILQTGAGRFVIAEACAGLNFLLAALALSVFFSAIAFADMRRRVAFVAAAAAAALVANVLRAFLVVFLSTTTPLGMAFAHDHAAFGLAIYAAFLFALMALGRRWRDAPAAPSPAVPPRFGASRPAPILLALAAILAAGLFGPLVADDSAVAPLLHALRHAG